MRPEVGDHNSLSSSSSCGTWVMMRTPGSIQVVVAVIKLLRGCAKKENIHTHLQTPLAASQ